MMKSILRGFHKKGELTKWKTRKDLFSKAGRSRKSSNSCPTMQEMGAKRLKMVVLVPGIFILPGWGISA
jgi:hypothetical protein